MTRPATALICAYYPQQLLPALAAVIEFRLHQGIAHDAPVTVLVWSDPGVGAAFLQQRQQGFETLLTAYPWVHLVFPSPDEVKAHLSPRTRVNTKARYLRSRFGQGAFDALFYAHDMGSDYLAQSAMQAFPLAARVCFGDALGVVYSNDYYTELTYPLGSIAQILRSPKQSLLNGLWRCQRHYTLPRRSQRLDAEFAALILPCDPGGDFLAHKLLLPISRNTLDTVLQGLAEGVARALGSDQASLAAQYADKHLMLLGSFSESGFTSSAQEQAMYVEAARLHIPSGATLLLKAHPASYGEKLHNIVQALQAQHDRVELTNAETNNLPVEVLRHLAQCQSVISFSYSSVSLVYLYGSSVVHAMTPELIDRYFPPHIQQWMHESNLLYLGQLDQALRRRHEQFGAPGHGTSTHQA